MEVNRFYFGILIAFLSFCLAACSTVTPQPTEDTTYLTPIPEATLRAFKSEGPIITKMQAAIFAINRSAGAHFRFIGQPKVISVEKISLAEAHKRIDKPEATPFFDMGLSSEVWFVVLEGDLQVNPPPSSEGTKVTTPTLFHDCGFVLFDGNNSGGRISGGIACPPKTP